MVDTSPLEEMTLLAVAQAGRGVVRKAAAIRVPPEVVLYLHNVVGVATADAANQATLVGALVAAVEEYHRGLSPNKQLPHNLCVICDLLRRVREAKEGSKDDQQRHQDAPGGVSNA